MPACIDALLADRPTIDDDCLGTAHQAFPGQCVEQFRLSVSGNPGNADHLPCGDVEIDIGKSNAERTIGGKR